MWGRHVEAELREATKKAKTDAQAQSKAMMVMRRLMDPPAAEPEEESQAPKPVSFGKFRDPAATRLKGMT